MRSNLLDQLARTERGRNVLCLLARRGIYRHTIEEALAREVVELIAAAPVAPPLLEPTALRSLVRLLLVSEVYVDDLPDDLRETVADVRAVIDEHSLRLPRFA
jgi:hypothetical protein